MSSVPRVNSNVIPYDGYERVSWTQDIITCTTVGWICMSLGNRVEEESILQQRGCCDSISHIVDQFAEERSNHAVVHNVDAVGCCHHSVKTSERINLRDLSLRRDSIETNVWYCSCIDCEFFGCCVPSQPRGLSSDWTTVKRERMSICVWEVAC